MKLMDKAVDREEKEDEEGSYGWVKAGGCD